MSMLNSLGYSDRKILSDGGKPSITIPDGLIPADCKLVGEDGNAFSIMGRAKRSLKSAGNGKDVIQSYMDQATSGDYANLLAVTAAFTKGN
jgi:hypothetical protein